MLRLPECPTETFPRPTSPAPPWNRPRPLVGRPIAEAMPELADQPVFGLPDQVYRTGETFRASEMLVQLDHANYPPQVLEKR